jgi:hypothetical protein
MHTFTLQPYQGMGSRYRCPQCDHRTKTFTRYINTQTGQHVAEHVGRCDREEKCGYHYRPGEYFGANGKQSGFTKPVRRSPPPQRKNYNVLHQSLVDESMKQKYYAENNLVIYLASYFKWEWALQAAERYNIGTTNHWPGAAIYWQIDIKGRVRTGKIMLYNPKTGKRVKEPCARIAWAHTLVGKSESQKSPKEAANRLSDFPTSGLSDYKLKQCLFGEHLLKNSDPQTYVSITESEKTAVVASLLVPQFTWLAAGSRNGLNADKCKVLAGRTVILFPDVGAYDDWCEKARDLNHAIPTAKFVVSDELERLASPEQRQQGIDWVDWWLG